MTEKTESDQNPPERDEEPRRRLVERLLPELIKRALEAGLGTLSKTDETLRGIVGEMKLPKEIAGYIFEQIDETKNGMLRIVAKEMRDFLEHTELAEEMRKVLTSLSFEIKTEIRFIPNDSAVVRPEVKATVTTRRAGKKEGSREGEP
jgi:hypothetical protein